MAKPTVFISHSHLDVVWCSQFATALEQLGYDVWYDKKGLSGGKRWVGTIAREIEARAIFAIVLTPQAWESDWVQEELELALSIRRRVIPILLRPTDITGFLRNRQRIDAMHVQPDAVALNFDADVDPEGALDRGVAGLYGGVTGGIVGALGSYLPGHQAAEPVEHGIASHIPGRHSNSTQPSDPPKPDTVEPLGRGVAGIVGGLGSDTPSVEHGIASHLPGRHNAVPPASVPAPSSTNSNAMSPPRGVAAVAGGQVGGVAHEAQAVEHGIGSHLPGHRNTTTPPTVPASSNAEALSHPASGLIGGVVHEAQAVEHGITSHLPGHHNRSMLACLTFFDKAGNKKELILSTQYNVLIVSPNGPSLQATNDDFSVSYPAPDKYIAVNITWRAPSLYIEPRGGTLVRVDGRPVDWGTDTKLSDGNIISIQPTPDLGPVHLSDATLWVAIG